MRYQEACKKVLRFWSIYGAKRTAFKIFGRTRRSGAWLLANPFASTRQDVAIIGCGQFAYASIAYVLYSRRGKCIRICFDGDGAASASYARSLGVDQIAASADEAINHPEVRVVYIASNHHSHTEYALMAARAGKDVYIEKPISVTQNQLASLAPQIESFPERFNFGYNRPFSAAIIELRKRLAGQQGALSLNCYVSGHQLDAHHWYRDPKEGTRICGNVGHWLDLAINLLSVNRLPNQFSISLAWADDTVRDDNLCLVLVSELGDIVNIVISSRTEPFEGINETINLQWGRLIAKINDFREMTIWHGSSKSEYRFRPKDIGHHGAILQPFTRNRRDPSEVISSTELMLAIKDMVVNGVHSDVFRLNHRNGSAIHAVASER